jgi:hypothetical protein
MIRPATRAYIDFANQLHEAQFRLVFKVQKTRGASMAAAPSVGKWPTAWNASVDHRSTECSCRLVAVHLLHVEVPACMREACDQSCMQCRRKVARR